MSDPAPYLAPHRFKPGVSGNPAGRPKGARCKLANEFLQAILDSFTEKVKNGDTMAGMDAIRRMRDTDPSAYIKAIASVIPKEITGEDGGPILTGIQVTFVRPKPQD